GGARGIGGFAAGDDGVGGLEEERRPAALGFRGGCRGAHLARMVGEVATDAVDPAHRERAAAAHRHARGRRRGNHVEAGHRAGRRGRGRIAVIARAAVQRSSGWPFLSTTRYSPSTTRSSRATGLPRWRSSRITSPPVSIAAPTNRPTTSSPASSSTPTTPSSARSSGWRGLRGANMPDRPAPEKREWKERKTWTDMGPGAVGWGQVSQYRVRNARRCKGFVKPE